MKSLRLFLIRWILIFGTLLLFANEAVHAKSSFHWTTEDIKRYRERHFVELSHTLIVRRQIERAKQVLDQDSDLSGCRALHNGGGGVAELQQCMAFMIREIKLQMKSQGSSELVRDVNSLCGLMAQKPENLSKLLRIRSLSGNQRLFGACQTKIWEQIYLTAYARFEADPVGMFSLVKKTEHQIGFNSIWTPKSVQLFQGQRP